MLRKSTKAKSRVKYSPQWHGGILSSMWKWVSYRDTCQPKIETWQFDPHDIIAESPRRGTSRVSMTCGERVWHGEKLDYILSPWCGTHFPWCGNDPDTKSSASYHLQSFFWHVIGDVAHKPFSRHYTRDDILLYGWYGAEYEMCWDIFYPIN